MLLQQNNTKIFDFETNSKNSYLKANFPFRLQRMGFLAENRALCKWENIQKYVCVRKDLNLKTNKAK